MEDREERVDETAGKKQKKKWEKVGRTANEGKKRARQEAAKAIDIQVLTSLHYSAVHEIREFAVKGYLTDRFKDDELAFQLLADKCRDSVAAAIQLDPEMLQCSIKVCEGTEEIAKPDWDVWTFARSEQLIPDIGLLRGESGPGSSQKIRDNSAYAALTGCFDGKIDWGPKAYGCFCCCDWKRHEECYVDSRSEWLELYRAIMVFPLRWIEEHEKGIAIKGFLSFYSLLPDVFTGVPCIFECKNNREAYFRKLTYSVAYHVGGIIADILATVIALEEANGNKDKEIKENVNGEQRSGYKD